MASIKIMILTLMWGKYSKISPYAYCLNNPINRIDPDGRADFWLNGKVIGNDGVDDQRVLVVRTEALTKKEVKETTKYIIANPIKAIKPSPFHNQIIKSIK